MDFIIIAHELMSVEKVPASRASLYSEWAGVNNS